jgi:glutathione synthase/RimK-type ligase-like ATP-grasp enzyme
MKDNGFKVPEEIGVYSDIDEIPEFSELPRKFVLKPSRGYSAQNVFVMSDGVNFLDGKIYD